MIKLLTQLKGGDNLNNDELLLKKRIEELSERSYTNGIYTSTEFLSPYEQNIVKSSVHGCPYTFIGGYDSSEKRIAIFGSEELCGYEVVSPVTFIKIEPSSEKFSDKLSHRDFLGAIMSLGLRRSTFGDIVVSNNTGYAVCLDSVADFVCENLISIKHTSVKCTKIDKIPVDAIPAPIENTFVVSSDRLDSVISSIYKISRSESKSLIEHEKVLLGGAVVTNADIHPNENDIITVKGLGKFIYCGIEKETKKGRLRCIAKIYK